MVLSAAFFLIFSCKFWASSLHLFLSRASLSLYLSISSFLNMILPQLGHVALRTSYIIRAYPTCITGFTNSMWPKCPGQTSCVCPHVSHRAPGSETPSLLSTIPPLTGRPPSSYTSDVVTSITEYLRIMSGLRTPNLIDLMTFRGIVSTSSLNDTA